MMPSLGVRRAVAFLACALACLAARAQDGQLEAVRKHKAAAIEHLRKAEDPTADRVKELKAAEASLLAAQKLLEAFKEPVPAEVEEELSEVNSLMYWTRKMMPQEAGGKARSTPGRKPSPAGGTGKPETEKKPTGQDAIAERHFQEAERFARENPDRPFFIAVRFFEVADRFQGTSWGVKAQRLALEYQRKALAAAEAGKPAEETVPGPAPPEPSRTEAAPKVIFPEVDAPEFDKVKLALEADTSRAQKIEACKAYLEASPDDRGSPEIKAVFEALGAETTAAGTLKWIDYLVSYPQGLMARRALEAVRRSEDTALAEVRQSLLVDDVDRALRISRTCLRALQGRPWAGEMNSVIRVLKLQPGAARTRLAREHAGRYPNGRLTGALREVAAQWERTDELDAFDSLIQSFAQARSREERAQAVGEFLKSYPGGALSPEAKALRGALTPSDPRRRLEGARAYLQSYPQGSFAAEMRKFAEESVEELDSQLFAEAMRKARDRNLSYKERLAAAERYLAEFAEGEGAPQVTAAAREIRALIEEEARAYEKLVASLEALGADTEGALKACSEFLGNHGCGAHASEVAVKRDEYKNRLSGEMEAEAYRLLVAKLDKPGLSRIESAQEICGFLGRYAQGRHSQDARKRLRDLAPGHLRAMAGPVRTAVFSPDSKTLVTLDADASRRGTGLWVWDVSDGRLVAAYRARSGFTACSASFGREGRELWVGEAGGGMISWDISGGRVLGRYRVGGGPVTATAPVGDGRVAVTASLGDEKLRLWAAADWTFEESVKCDGGVSAAATSPDGRLVAVGLADGGLACYRAGSSQRLWAESRAHARAVAHLCFSPDGRHLASCSPDAGTLSLRDAERGREIWSVNDSTPTVAFAGAAGVLTSAGIRAAESGSMRVKLDGAGPVAASPDGKFGLTTDTKGGGTLWYLPALLE